MKRHWQALSLIGAIMLSGAVGWQQWDGLRDEVSENTTARLLQTYDRLFAKFVAEGRLSTRDAVQFCNAARRLDIGGPVVAQVCR